MISGEENNSPARFSIEALGQFELYLKTNAENSISEKQKTEADRIWQESLDKGRELFNGDLLYFIERQNGNPGRIYAGRIDYKYYYGERQAGWMDERIKPIGVSGCTIIDNKWILLAERSQIVTSYPGFIEMAPSGSLDLKYKDEHGRIDFKAKIIEEFQEEVGITLNDFSVREFAFIFDAQEKEYDVCVRIDTRDEIGAIRTGFLNSSEYRNPLFIEISSLEKFVQENYTTMVPASIGIAEILLGKVQ